jgi:5,10-methylenetetrahydromethanopterin reductase
VPQTPTLAGSVNLMPIGPVARVAELAVEAERLGYRRCWVYDEGLVTRDVYVTLTAVAAATSTIRIGPGITNPFTRHPGVTANAIASLDEFSGGRAFLGLGAGGGLTLDPLGIERHRPLTAVEEMVDSTRRLWSGAKLDLRGETIDFRSAGLSLARDGIEIHLAGRGPRMIELAGRSADGFYLSYVHKALIGPTVEKLRLVSGRPMTVTYSTRIVITDDDFEMARRDLTFRLPDSPADVRDRLGIGPNDVAALRGALAEGGPAAAAHLVRDSWVTPFVIAGSRHECARELAGLAAEHGLDEFLLQINDLDAGPALMADTMAMISAGS